MHSSHGGNGRAFTDSQARGDLTITEAEMNQIYIDSARAILAGKVSIDDEAVRISRQRKSSVSTEKGKLDTMVGILRSDDEAAAAKAKESKAAKSKAAAPATERAPRVRLEQVAPEQFKALRDELGLTNKQCAEANLAAGLGSTLSRITELTHSKGSTIRIYEKVEQAWRSYAKKHKVKPVAAGAVSDVVQMPGRKRRVA